MLRIKLGLASDLRDCCALEWTARSLADVAYRRATDSMVPGTILAVELRHKVKLSRVGEVVALMPTMARVRRSSIVLYRPGLGFSSTY